MIGKVINFLSYIDGNVSKRLDAIASNSAEFATAGGLAALEFAKDSDLAAVGTVSSALVNSAILRKIAERKFALAVDTVV